MQVKVDEALRRHTAVPGRDAPRAVTTSTHDAGLTYHTSRQPVLSVADITGVPAGRGLHWSPRGWELITLNPWWQQRSSYRL
ncbi:hypothetical protein MSM1_20580 [Mycobacterium sp. SM1]|uniref:hypothetical protein n=1 Tax=Mycobacterium sp. SM1 TaxID=2816243 RepID=UPI001BCEE03A|nr:hypothetical protein [Mycobacterium sp. SM1]MBS4730611.1 hypothetical protein [Mycobacterium sp. SM1]